LREHLYVKFLNSCILLSIFLKMLVWKLLRHLKIHLLLS
jgi:hypothetical protein